MATLGQSHAAEITNEISIIHDPVIPNAVLIQSIINIAGIIEPGDAEKIKANFVSVVEQRNSIIASKGLRLFTKHNIFYISSGGGQVAEAFEIARVLRAIEATGPTMIAVKGTCASACAVILFSIQTRFARLCDRIGIHRAAIAGVEDDETFSASTEIADYLIKNGVPWDVVKKMLLTSASNISWLTLEDMRLANLSVLPGACVQQNSLNDTRR